MVASEQKTGRKMKDRQGIGSEDCGSDVKGAHITMLVCALFAIAILKHVLLLL